MEYPDGCITTTRHVAKKMATVKGRLVRLGGDITAGM